MNRRVFAGWLAASSLTTALAMSRSERDVALAHTLTPVQTFDGGECNLDLDFADFTAQLEIPEEIGWEQYDLIVSIVSARIHRLGWSSCNVSRYEREVLVNVQVEQGAELDLDLIGDLLTTPGRVDLIDIGEGDVEIGETVTTSSTPVDLDGPEVNVVYTSLLTNLDFASAERTENPAGETALLLTVHDAVVDRVTDFTNRHVGAPLPLVIDGVVTLMPIVQPGIESELLLQPVEPELAERLRLFLAAPPLPGPLTLADIRDNRATPTA